MTGRPFGNRGEGGAIPPLYLTREEAARYVRVSVRLFDAEVRAGKWPAPEMRGAAGSKPTWYRPAIDAAAARRHETGGTDDAGRKARAAAVTARIAGLAEARKR
jgi:hypothetical protein